MRRWSRLLRGGVDRNQTEVVLAWQEQTSPPARRRGSKPMPLHRQHRPNGRLLRGGVDRNSCVRGWAVTRVRRLLRGGVDRNVGATLGAFIVARSPPDRKSVVSGKSVSVRLVLGGRRMMKKTNTEHLDKYYTNNQSTVDHT